MFRTVSLPIIRIQHNLYVIYLWLCVQCWIPDEGQRDCPKHVEFYSNNKFEKLVHLVGFIIRTVLACCIDFPMGWTSEELCSDYGQGHKISVLQLSRCWTIAFNWFLRLSAVGKTASYWNVLSLNTFSWFYFCVSVHRSTSQIKHQLDATLCFISAESLYMFRASSAHHQEY